MRVAVGGNEGKGKLPHQQRIRTPITAPAKHYAATQNTVMCIMTIHTTLCESTSGERGGSVSPLPLLRCCDTTPCGARECARRCADTTIEHGSTIGGIVQAWLS